MHSMQYIECMQLDHLVKTIQSGSIALGLWHQGSWRHRVRPILPSMGCLGLYHRAHVLPCSEGNVSLCLEHTPPCLHSRLEKGHA